MATYTAKEMRTVADHMCSDFTFARIPSRDGMLHRDVGAWEVAEMLRQAADALERDEESDVVRCRKCQTERTGEGYGDVPPHVGEDDICDRCEIAEQLRRGKDADEREREKRYEYGVSASYGVDVYGSLELVRRVARGNARVVRREVGEWEELSDVQQ